MIFLLSGHPYIGNYHMEHIQNVIPKTMMYEPTDLSKPTKMTTIKPPLPLQAHTHQTMSSPSQNTLKIGIVGFGPFAQFLAKTMIKQGHCITATSRSDHSNLCTQMGILFSRNMNEFLESDSDVILFCTSILSLSQVISTIPFSFLKKPVLFADVLSVKEHPRDLMLQVLPHESDVLCTHPMFGPDSGKHGWKGLTFMYDKIRIRNEEICSSFLQIFSSEGCKMMEMTCEEHDKSAARTQFLTHFIGRLFGQLNIERTPIDTLGFQKLVEVKESTMRDSFDLYNGLFIHNRFAREELRKLELAFEATKQQLRKGNDEKQEPSIQTLQLTEQEVNAASIPAPLINDHHRCI